MKGWHRDGDVRQIQSGLRLDQKTSCRLTVHGTVTDRQTDILIYNVSQKNDNDVLRYNFNAHQLILIIFGRDIAE